MSQVREEVHFTKGRIIVRGKLVSRGKDKFADYILYYKPNIPIALIEAKDNNLRSAAACSRGSDMLRPWIFRLSFPPTEMVSSCMIGQGQSDDTEVELTLDEFPSPR